MRLDLTADEQLHADTTRRFLAGESPIPTVRAWSSTALGFDTAWWQRGAELGWTSLLAPESLSGGTISGAGLLDLTSVAHAFGAHVAPGPLVSTNLAVLAVAQLGDAYQQERLLTAVLDGTCIPAWTGASATALPTGTVTSSGGIVIDGELGPVEGGAWCPWFVVTVETADGLRQAIVPADGPGVEVQALHGLDLGRRWCRVRLDGVRVPAEDVLGKDALGDDGDVVRAALSRQLQVATVIQMAESCGSVDTVFAFTLQWLFDRHSFGRPLASYQELKHRAADMRMWAEACHATADAAAEAVQHEAPDADLLVHVAASWVGDRSVDIVQDCVQMHGGIGVTAEHDIHLYLRRVAQNRQLLGTPDQHRMAVTDHVERLLA